MSSSRSHANGNNANKSTTSSAEVLLASQRGLDAVTLLPTYLADARTAQPRYHKTQAPHGALQLGVAENYLMQDWLVRDLTEKQKEVEFDASQIYYQPTQGREMTRRAMCRFFSQILSSNYRFQEDCMVIGAGCNAVLENLAFCLANTGDAVLIPTPYYAAFEFDLVARAGLKIQPVTTFKHSNADIDDKKSAIPVEAYYPNKHSLDAAYEKSLNEGSCPRILLLSSPNNPLGICYPSHVIEECIDWCEERSIHLVSDEIYAGSVYRNPDTDGTNIVPWTSVAEVAAKSGRSLGSMIHIVYALSKDFSLSGLRVGALYSENKEIAVPLQKLNDLCQVSAQTQVMVERMLDPEQNSGWTGKYLSESHDRLKSRCKHVEDLLEELDIPFLKGEAGLFLWMDLREFLPNNNDDDQAKERSLYLDLLKAYGLLFTPGLSMKTEIPGFFRFVFTAAANEDEFEVALMRIKKFVLDKRQR